MRTLVLQDDEGQVAATHSIAAAMNYPAVGPQHAELAARGRAEYTSVTDAEAIAAFHLLSEAEGILPSLESAHALAEVAKHAPELAENKVVLVMLSGRGDGDAGAVASFDGDRRGASDGSDARSESGRRPRRDRPARDWGAIGPREPLAPGELEVLETMREPPEGTPN